jgi:hypothetical protein
VAAVEDSDHGATLLFIADDLFINFDADRAAAGFKVLVISQKGPSNILYSSSVFDVSCRARHWLMPEHQHSHFPHRIEQYLPTKSESRARVNFWSRRMTWAWRR